MKISKNTRTAVITLVMFFSSLIGFLLMPLQACASNFQDLWWNPSESGWGVNIAHQADTLFATWFIYDSSGKSTWVVMSDGAKTAKNTYSGTVYRTTGSAFSAPIFNPLSVTVNPVGTATFTFTDPYHATLIYTVDGVTVSKQIMRQTFKNPPIAGSYYLISIGTTSGCTLQPSNNGPYASLFTMTVSVNGSAMTVKMNELSADETVIQSFTLSGNYNQYGALLSATIKGNVDPGVLVSMTMSEVQFTENGFIGKGSATNSYDTCVDTSTLMGFRLS